VSVSYNKNVKHTLLYGGGYLNNRIKELRKEHKITQDELAGAVGVTRQTIISLENGKYNASLQLAYRIARYFNRYIEDVFVFEEEA
jgi:putative transcriptional regulator